MPSDLPGNIKRKKLIPALKRLGFEIDTRGGDGSHCKVTWPQTQKVLTIQQRIDKAVLSRLLKQVEKITNRKVTAEDIMKEI